MPLLDPVLKLALLTILLQACRSSAQCTWVRSSIDDPLASIVDARSFVLKRGAWDCDGVGSSSPLAAPLAHSIDCLKGRWLNIVGDSISRTMLFDFLSSLYNCDRQPPAQSTLEKCNFFKQARNNRGDYDAVIPWHLLDGSVAGRDVLWDVHVSFRTATVVRNISASPWFQGIFFSDPNSVPSDSIVLFNAGLWNLRYDSPRSDVPGGFLRELNDLAQRISRHGSPRYAQQGRPRRLFWRAITPMEPAGNPDFPSDYTPALVQQANEGAWAIMHDVAGSVGKIDLTYRTQAMPSPIDGNAPSLTVDGTHFHPWLNAVMMRDSLSGICALEQWQRDLEASAAGSDDSYYASGTVPSLRAEGETPWPAPAAESDASPAASPAAGEGPTSTPSPAAVPAAASRAPPAALAPAPPGALPAVSIIAALVAAAVALHRSRLRTAARSRIGIACTLAFVWLLVSSIERWGAIPIVGKERGVGMDMLWAVFGLAVVVGALTLVRSLPEQQRAQRPTHREGSNATRGSGDSRSESGASAATPAAAGGKSANDVLSTLPQQQQPSDPSSADSAATVAIAVAAAAADAGAANGGAMRHREAAAAGQNDGSAASAEQEQASLLRDTAAAGPDVESAGPSSGAAAAALDSTDRAAGSGSADAARKGSPRAASPSAAGDAGRSSETAAPSAGSSSSVGTVSHSSAARTHAPAPSDEPAILSLDVCNELKGLCMVCFLLYHYWDVKAVYNPIRVMVAVFLFLTGYGNFLSLSASSQPPKLHKLCLSFIRINLLAAVLMTAVRAPWMLYYICPLHTFWTIVVYVFFWVVPSANGDRKRLGIKLGALTAALVLLFEVPSLADWLFWPLWPLLQYRGSMFEWVFRARLDAYSSLFGMWLAFGRPELTSVLAWANRTGRIAVGGLAAALASVFLIHAALLYPLAKGDYNGLHRFTTWLPIATYALLRCCTAPISHHFSRLFTAVGSCSLDLYLLQFHLWLAHSSKDILGLVPGARALSFFVNTAAFLAIAWLSAQAQNAVLSTLASAQRSTFAATIIVLVVLISGTCVWG